VVAGALVAAAVFREGGHDVLLLVIGAAAAAVFAGGLVLRWSGALAVGVALLGAQQATRLALGPDALDEATPLTAGALLLAAELGWWSIEPRIPAWTQPGVAPRRAATVLFTFVAATVVSAVVVVAAGVQVGGGTLLLLSGIVAATAALGVLAYVARRSP
jgi:hypothetical protein